MHDDSRKKYNVCVSCVGKETHPADGVITSACTETIAETNRSSPVNQSLVTQNNNIVLSNNTTDTMIITRQQTLLDLSLKISSIFNALIILFSPCMQDFILCELAP